MTDLPPGLDEKMEALRRAYASGLPAKLDAIRTAAQPLAGDAPDAAAISAVTELRALAHKLTGSAPTFGFATVGDVAAEIETLCDGLVETGDPPAAADRTRLTELVDALERACGTAK